MPGVAYFAPVYQVEPDLEKVKQKIAACLDAEGFESFAVRVKRPDKTFPLTSPQIERKLGAFIQNWSGMAVNLRRPQLTVYAEWLRGKVLLYWKRIPAPAGLPIGVAGKVLCLLPVESIHR